MNVELKGHSRNSYSVEFEFGKEDSTSCRLTVGDLIPIKLNNEWMCAFGLDLFLSFDLHQFELLSNHQRVLLRYQDKYAELTPKTSLSDLERDLEVDDSVLFNLTNAIIVAQHSTRGTDDGRLKVFSRVLGNLFIQELEKAEVIEPTLADGLQKAVIGDRLAEVCA